MLPLPRNWQVINFDNVEKNYFCGVSYTDASDNHEAVGGAVRWYYCLYLTDFNYVWMCEVDTDQLKSKARDLQYETDSLKPLFDVLVSAFSCVFHDDKIKMRLEQANYDNGVPLGKKIRMEMSLPLNPVPFVWTFDLNRLPDSSTISIIKNLVQYQATVSFALNEYNRAMQKEIERKDNLIRILTENMSPETARIVDNGPNRKAALKFEEDKFEEEWKAKVLPQYAKGDIWTFLTKNTESQLHTFGSIFIDSNYTRPAASRGHSRKRSAVVVDKDLPSDFVPQIESSPIKKNRGNMENLSGSFKEELKLEGKDVPAQATPEPVQQPFTSSPDRPQTPRRDSSTQTVKKEKRRSATFGVSQKRKVYQPTYSPIKAPRL